MNYSSLMGINIHTKLSSVFLTFSCFLPFLVHALDTITASHSIREQETLSSNNKMFTLGFFSPENSTNRYLGIWHMTNSTVIWVANRNRPLKDSSGIVTISEDNNLVVLGAQKQVIWSTNVSKVASNSTAQLLDSGNLVLLDRTVQEPAWESFLHPSDTLLSNLKLSTNTKTGEKVQMTSWKSPADPSSGRFSSGIEIHNVVEAFIRNDNHPYWRSGPWNGHVFLGVPGMTASFLDGFRLEESERNFDLYFNQYVNKSILRIFVLTSQGNIEQRLWNYEMKKWELEWISQESECDVYGICGPFGICNSQKSPICSCLTGFEPRNKEEWDRQNWTGGCVQKEALQCERLKNGSEDGKADGFLKLQNAKVPDFAEWSFLANGDCRAPCLKNCSCIAYAYDTGIGCLFWSGDLFDMQQFPYGGTDLYLRLAYSELDEDNNITVIVSITVTIGSILVAISAYLLWKRIAKHAVKAYLGNRKGSKIHNLNQVRIKEVSLFDFRILAIATNNFDLANKLGQGGFGPGKLQDGQEIAVKRLSRASGQGTEQFINEVEVISKLQHRNLVRLLGCCIDGDEEMLVYECMPNKSLDAYIFDPLRRKCLDWKKRFNIIEGIVRGLLYLHRDSRLRIIHRDLKTSNILLDEWMNPKISEFGMARIFGGNENEANTQRVVGTYGYISPEYANQGLFSEKSDVFSFGVLLLEIVSGRRSTSFCDDSQSLSLLGFAWKLWNDHNITSLVDRDTYDPSFHKQILRCIHIGLLCVQELARDRPNMVMVISMLNNEFLEIPPPMQPAFVYRQTMPNTAVSILRGDQLCSINNVTITNFEGR